MKVGYSVEGSTDRAFLTGLRDRWCPDIEPVEGHFRGRSGQSQKREMPKTCMELTLKDADLIIFMRDANDENWRDVLKADTDRCKAEHRHLVVIAVCDRNIECWICADKDWIAKKTGRKREDFDVGDPKGIFESAMGITSRDKKEEEIAALIREAPLHRWLANKSFESFYLELWRKSKSFSCKIENLREN